MNHVVVYKRNINQADQSIMIYYGCGHACAHSPQDRKIQKKAGK